MHLRSPRTAATQPRRLMAAAALTLAVMTGTSGCALTGFHDATTRDYTAANGVNVDEPQATVALIGTVVVSATDGTGTLVVNLVNKTDQPISLDSVKGVAGDTAVTAAPFEPISIPARGSVALAGTEVDGVRLDGDFAAGQFLRLTLGFDDGSQIMVNAPVAPDDREFDGYDNAPTPAEEATP